jgi:hypothetical protein
MFCNKAWHFWHNKLKYVIMHSQVLSDVLRIALQFFQLGLMGHFRMPSYLILITVRLFFVFSLILSKCGICM